MLGPSRVIWGVLILKALLPNWFPDQSVLCSLMVPYPGRKVLRRVTDFPEQPPVWRGAHTFPGPKFSFLRPDSPAGPNTCLAKALCTLPARGRQSSSWRTPDRSLWSRTLSQGTMMYGTRSDSKLKHADGDLHVPHHTHAATLIGMTPRRCQGCDQDTPSPGPGNPSGLASRKPEPAGATRVNAKRPPVLPPWAHPPL